MKNETYPFELPALPYSYDALEPYIDAETMHYHHDKHFKAYIDNLNAAIEPYPNLHKLTLEQLLTRTRFLPQEVYTKIKNNGGGVYNHDFFFSHLAPPLMEGYEPDARLKSEIAAAYGSTKMLMEQMKENAMKVFGSGWTCLAYTRQGSLRIINLKNQETVLDFNAKPVMLTDVWEHAYYLKYKNERAKYLDAIENVLIFAKTPV